MFCAVSLYQSIHCMETKVLKTQQKMLLQLYVISSVTVIYYAKICICLTASGVASLILLLNWRILNEIHFTLTSIVLLWIMSTKGRKVGIFFANLGCFHERSLSTNLLFRENKWEEDNFSHFSTCIKSTLCQNIIHGNETVILITPNRSKICDLSL